MEVKEEVEKVEVEEEVEVVSNENTTASSAYKQYSFIS